MSHNRDVLAELFSDPETQPQPEQAELIRLIYRRDSKEPEIKRTHSAGSTHDSHHSAGKRKKKATYYLSEKLVVELSGGNARIKVQVPSGLKAKVSMSRIVDNAIGAILKEFNQAGKKGDLMHQCLTEPPKKV